MFRRCRRILPTPVALVSLHQTILKGVESVDADVEAIWLETLLRATESLPNEVIADEILSLAVAKGSWVKNFLAPVVAIKLIVEKFLDKLFNPTSPAALMLLLLLSWLYPLYSASGHSPHLSSRLASSRLLGKIASKFDAFLLQREVLPVVQSLCQDVDHQVRARSGQGFVLSLGRVRF